MQGKGMTVSIRTCSAPFPLPTTLSALPTGALLPCPCRVFPLEAAMARAEASVVLILHAALRSLAQVHGKGGRQRRRDSLH